MIFLGLQCSRVWERKNCCSTGQRSQDCWYLPDNQHTLSSTRQLPCLEEFSYQQPLESGSGETATKEVLTDAIRLT
jgi:hypothetical protein